MASGRADWSFQQALSSPAGEALWQKRVLDCERDYLRFKTRWVTDWDIPKFLMPKSNLDKLYNQLKSIIQTATPHLIVDRDDPREGMYAINDKDKEALNLITVKSFSFSAQQLLEGTELKKFLKDKIHASYGVIPNQRDTEVLLTGYAKSIIQKLMEEFEKELIAQYGNRYPTKYTAFHEYYNNKQFANEIMGRFIPKTLSQYVIKITEELTTTLVESKHIQLSPIEGEIYKRLSAAPDMKDVNTISPAEVLRSILDTCKSSKIGATPLLE